MTRTISPAARRLRELRKAKKISLRELEALSGVDRAHLSRLENGLRPMAGLRPKTVSRIAAWLDVTPEELMATKDG